MPRFLFQSPDHETGGTIETDWLELPDIDAACRAAEEAVREAALEFEGLGVVTVLVLNETQAAVHRAEIEIRNEPCGTSN
ncbi:hypothetical protein ASG72_08245 [Bosea sp. Leaf344]|nr:hypothetical protein ASG72_08245 [Bosea sp. Leaf344]